MGTKIQQAVTKAYKALDKKGAFEVGGKLFGYHAEEQAEYIIAHDEGVSATCIPCEVNPEQSYEDFKTRVADYLKDLHKGLELEPEWLP